MSFHKQEFHQQRPQITQKNIDLAIKNIKRLMIINVDKMGIEELPEIKRQIKQIVDEIGNDLEKGIDVMRIH